MTQFGAGEKNSQGSGLSLKDFAKAIKSGCCIKTIDFEECLYVDFHNGFNVEISGYRRKNSKNKFTLYLWYGETFGSCICTDTLRDVERTPQAIKDGIHVMEEKAKSYLMRGLDNVDKLRTYLYEEDRKNRASANKGE